MSIRMLAIEFYRAKKRVEELRKRLENTPLGHPDRDDLEWELRSALEEEKSLGAMLEGAKS